MLETSKKVSVLENENEQPEQPKRPVSVSLLDESAEETSVRSDQLTEVKIGENETLLVAFTDQAGLATLHYDSDMSQYVHCNGKGCIPCHAGIAQTKTYLFPVYLPVDERIGVLRVNFTRTPQALLPQIINLLKSPETLVASVSRKNSKIFKVTTRAMPVDGDTGEDQILEFLEKYDKGEVDLGSVFARVSNDEFEQLPSIAKRLKYTES